jgi:hypothetical protein
VEGNAFQTKFNHFAVESHQTLLRCMEIHYGCLCVLFFMSSIHHGPFSSELVV